MRLCKGTHSFFMAEAIKEARKGLRQGGIPIGAVLVRNGCIISRGHNRRVQKGSPILHAEMDCFANAGRISASGYRNCVLYSTLSPCDMCSGAALLFKIPVIVIGENSTFKGPEAYLKKRGVRVIDLDCPACKEMMRSFISRNRALWREDISV
ncbi:MAG: nucleoside deaminase [Candidatus Omnitrophota bacterium]